MEWFGIYNWSIRFNDDYKLDSEAIETLVNKLNNDKIATELKEINDSVYIDLFKIHPSVHQGLDDNILDLRNTVKCGNVRYLKILSNYIVQSIGQNNILSAYGEYDIHIPHPNGKENIDNGDEEDRCWEYRFEFSRKSDEEAFDKFYEELLEMSIVNKKYIAERTRDDLKDTLIIAMRKKEYSNEDVAELVKKNFNEFSGGCSYGACYQLNIDECMKLVDKIVAMVMELMRIMKR
jgi:hypothetical protein